MWYYILDVLLTLLHLVIIGFNLFGWIWKTTRRAHFYVVLATAFSWLVLGIWFGLGYCPLTDWQWQVKESLGEQGLPNSFIKYLVDKVTGLNSNPDWVDTVTAISFAIVTLLSIYLNIFRRNRRL